MESLEAAEISFIQTINNKLKSPRRSNGRSYDNLNDYDKKVFRPKHRPTAPGVGKEVDSIEWYRKQVKEKESKLKEVRQSQKEPHDNGAAAVFVEFRTLSSAQKAYQQVTSADILSLNPRFTGVVPSEVIWSNLTLPTARRISQQGMALSIIVALILFWSIPVAFVGAWSNVSFLAEKFKWLGFLNKLPNYVLGLLTGLVPPLLTSLLSKYVPNIYRCKLRCIWIFRQPTNRQ